MGIGIASTNGAQLFICATPSLDATDTKAEFEALTWLEVKEVESLGQFGDTSQTITFTALSDARTRKRKGTRDAGDMAVSCGMDARDVGQLALVAAEATDFRYPFKVVVADAPDANDTDSTFYFHALVASAPVDIGGANKIVMRNFNLLIDTKPLEVPSAAVA